MSDRSPLTVGISVRELNANERSWIHDQAALEASPEKLAQLRRILRDQMDQVIRGEAPNCACCRLEGTWLLVYRCFQCGAWFCPLCSEAHYGPEVAAARRRLRS